MALRITGSVIGEPITPVSTSATGMWTSQEVAALQYDQTWQAAVTYSLTASASNVNEGSFVTATLTTTGLANGTVIPYVITGSNVFANDFTSGNITGNFVIQNGSNTISFTANTDSIIEGAETFTITAGTASANIIINDTPFDAYVANNVLLLHGNGTNNSQNNTFLDSAISPSTVTRNGNSTQGTFTPYGSSWSNYFDGSGDYLSIASAAPLQLDTGDFTIEFWWNGLASGAFPQNIGTLVSSAENGTYRVGTRFNSTNYVYFARGNGTSFDEVTYNVNVNDGAWHHIACVRTSGVIAMYVDGLARTAATGSTSISGTCTTSNPLLLGYQARDGTYATGYISNARIVKGTAVYTSNFAPPTTPLTAIANTSLLTCQSNNFKDNSTNNFTVTRNGDVSIQRFSPFNTGSVYSAGVIGGSAYFDGTGDYLTVPDSTIFTMGAGDFTLECWVYLQSVAQQVFIGTCDAAGSQGSMSFVLGLNGSAYPQIGVGYGGSMYVSTFGTAATAGRWYHIAGVRNGANVNIYVNGVKGPDLPMAALAITDSSQVVGIGRNGAGNFEYVTGYISDVRIIKGTAVYTGNFTPPTAPLLVSGTSSIYPNTANVNTTFAAANTSLLCNFTNAGIIDNAMMLNLETVGDSKISTTQSKFGGSSMSFDGTGDFLVSPSNSVLVFGTGDFTVECWVYTPAIAEKGILQTSDTAGGFKTSYTTGIVMAINSSGYWRFLIGSGNLDTTVAPVINTWTHLAVTRASGQVKTFINGTVATTATVTDNLTGNYIGIGSYYNTTYGWNGYIDDLRITKGVARYTANFTPPTSEFLDY